jgi:hypothetical protein
VTDDLGDYRWSGYSLRQKQGWMRDGSGPAAVTPATDYLDSLSRALDESRQRLDGTLGQLGVHWSGSGAAAARESLNLARGTAGGLRDGATGTRGGLNRYGESFARVKLRIPGLLELDVAAAVPGDLSAVDGALGDVRSGPAAAQRADQAANAALTAHERTTRDVLATSPDVRSRSTVDRSATATSAADIPANAGTWTDGGRDGSRHEGDRHDGDRHDGSGAFGALPVVPPGDGGYRPAPSQPARVVDPADRPFPEPAPHSGTVPGGVLDAEHPAPPPAPPPSEPAPRHWTALPHRAGRVPGAGTDRAYTEFGTTGLGAAGPLTELAGRLRRTRDRLTTRPGPASGLDDEHVEDLNSALHPRPVPAFAPGDLEDTDPVGFAPVEPPPEPADPDHAGPPDDPEHPEHPDGTEHPEHPEDTPDTEDPEDTAPTEPVRPDPPHLDPAAAHPDPPPDRDPTDYDAELDAEFDRELGMDVDPPDRWTTPDHHRDQP